MLPNQHRRAGPAGKRRARRRIGALSALFLLGLCRLPAQERDLPGPETLEAINGVPGIIKAAVSQERGDDRIRWIEMWVDVHTVSAIPLDRLRRTILDFERYPRIFRRNHETSVVLEGGAVCLDMTVGAQFFGIDFLVRYRVAVTEVRDTPEEFILEFTHVSDDGGVKDVSGWWHIKKLPPQDGAGQRCYIRYQARSKVVRKYPLQRMIMSLFIHSESRDLMNQFLKMAGG
jgi:hypothetical protein